MTILSVNRDAVSARRSASRTTRLGSVNGNGRRGCEDLAKRRATLVRSAGTIPGMTRTASLLVAIPCLLSVGCVQRTISITSEPAGALVYLNDEEVGRTPVVVPFTFYGVYDVRMEADGYHPLWTQQKAQAPWWETPGIDLFAEMVPDKQAELHWHFVMDRQPPAEAVDADLLLEHAKQLRAATDRAADAAVESEE